jgi:hypothetical protein
VSDLAAFAGDQLRAIREGRRMTLQMVEDMSGGAVGWQSLGCYERADRPMSVERLGEILDLYGVSSEEFFNASRAAGTAARATADLLEGAATAIAAMADGIRSLGHADAAAGQVSA